MRPRRAEPRITNPATHPRRYVALTVAAAYLEVDRKTLATYLEEFIRAEFRPRQLSRTESKSSFPASLESDHDVRRGTSGIENG
jgi:hypothetical protein